MNTLTSYLLQNPTALVVLLPFALLAALVIYVVTFPASRPVQSRRADKFHPSKVPPNLDTIVIGSGSGGSTVANLLAQSGQRVLVLEQHSVTGGCTHSFREEGCEWDTGLASCVLV
jgi:all-trans-retinol 13,14-reductase